ncbi:DUF4139 domain-containing protein [uncultured Parasphingorhabdus sp.]|uniref:DUF4139 domain-containing protein n=1 Tax=uncultured Parasphingorhabdus sp. TaxID=2709694 RepID=UPI003747AEBC
MVRRTFFAFLILAVSAPAAAQSGHAHQVVISDGPGSVSVTVYRNPDRAPNNAMNLRYLGGYALITEQRTIDLPEGEVDLRFEGVAGGIIPQSAIVTGLPDDIIEKNRDAALLSPSALLNSYLGQGVTIRRTSAVTGETEIFDATIRTDAGGGMVIQTADGFEALQCTGLNEAIVYPAIPEGLSAKPTLSLKSRVKTATRATVTLSYLATGFDWQANYVADISDDGSHLNLFSWVTLANGDETSFVQAQTQTVAGQPNKGRDNIAPAGGGSVNLACWPDGTSSDIIAQYVQRREAFGAAPPPPPPPPAPAMMADNITVTARKVMAKQEDLGDLKLYRIPVPVTVAAQSQKQVAFLEKSAIPFTQIYETIIRATNAQPARSMSTTLRFENRKRNQLGVPLPAGKLIAFRNVDGARMLLGEGSFDDKAIDELVEVTIGSSDQVKTIVEQLAQVDDEKKQARDMRLTLTNASRLPAQVEIKLLRSDSERFRKTSHRLTRKNGTDIWDVTVPPNSERVLTYRVERRK